MKPSNEYCLEINPSNIFILDYLGHPALIFVELLFAMCRCVIKIYRLRDQRARNIQETSVRRAVARGSRFTAKLTMP
jgi:hypothetical protein